MHINRKRIERNAMVFIAAALPAFLPALAMGQSAGETRGVVGVGSINANDVYVRSGDSLNHYTICKLQAGDQVSVVGERGEWYEIVPPPGTFSLVSGDFVDTADNQSGVINGDNVRVRAGSLLNENKYTVQTLVAKGTEVTIFGRNPDGFVRIKPPAGATLWIHKNFVGMRGGSTIESSAESPTPPTSQPLEGVVGVPPAVSSSAAESARKLSSPMVGAATTTWRRQLEEIDVAARAELSKPVLERRFAPMAARYEPIAGQTEDDFAREYAKARLVQVGDLASLTEAIDRVRGLDEKGLSKRRDFLAARNLIPEPIPFTPPTGVEIQGELRISALYPPDSPTPRYRLVDPSDKNDRTIGYVEIAQDSGLDVGPFLGQWVGVRASAQRIQTGGVNPIPIYIARELVPLTAPQEKTAETGPN